MIVRINDEGCELIEHGIDEILQCEGLLESLESVYVQYGKNREYHCEFPFSGNLEVNFTDDGATAITIILNNGELFDPANCGEELHVLFYDTTYSTEELSIIAANIALVVLISRGFFRDTLYVLYSNDEGFRGIYTNMFYNIMNPIMLEVCDIEN